MSLRSAAILVFACGAASACSSVEASNTDAQLKSFAVIYGVVTGPDGNPVAGARVQMRENVRAASVASQAGGYRLSVETQSLVTGAQTVLFVIIAPPGSAVRDTTERHARVTLYPTEPVPDSTAVPLVADQRR